MRTVGSGLAAIERHDSRADVYLTRPREENALTVDLLKDLTEAFRRLDADPEINAITLLGQGDVFSAGLDTDVVTDDPAVVDEYLETFAQLLELIDRVRQPVVAGIKAAALGPAFELTLAADLRVLDREGAYGLADASLGAFPQGGGTQRLPRLVGLSKAMELVLRDENVDPESALEIGLVHEVVDSSDVDEVAMEIADDLCTKPPIAIQNAKRSVKGSFEMPLDRGLIYERALGREAREALARAEAEAEAEDEPTLQERLHQVDGR